uniref:Uncharacterized protein n=1 Tax=Anopheles merus TaxID=30066 RepID=A0A182V187_ANOME
MFTSSRFSRLGVRRAPFRMLDELMRTTMKAIAFVQLRPCRPLRMPSSALDAAHCMYERIRSKFRSGNTYFDSRTTKRSAGISHRESRQQPRACIPAPRVLTAVRWNESKRKPIAPGFC